MPLCALFSRFGAGAAPAQSRLHHSASVGGEAQGGSLQQQQQQQPRAGATVGGSDTGSPAASRTGDGGRTFSRAKSFVQQRLLPWPNQAPQGGKDSKEDKGGGLGGGDGSRGTGGEEPKDGGGNRAPAVSRPKSRSFMDQLPQPWPWQASPRFVEGDDGSRGRATNLGPLPKAASLAEKLPRPQQVISQGKTSIEDVDGRKNVGEEVKEGGGRGERAGEGTARATSATEGLPGVGRTWASRGDADGNGNQGGDGSVGEGEKPATRGTVTKGRSLMERLPRPKQVLQGE